MSAKQALGRSFGSLIPEDLDKSILEDEKHRIQNLLIDDVLPNPEQPRREFDPSHLQDLADSIKRYGVLQPIVVIRVKGQNGYQIVAGERRWRAAKAVELTHVPAIVRSLDELEKLELSLIENIQRVDLSPLEQALAVLKLQQQFNMTVEQIAQKLGKASSTVSNLTRLLQLPESAREALRQGDITEGHARAILALRGNNEKQEELLRSIISNKWTVRQAEEFVIKHRKASIASENYNAKAIVSDLSNKLGTKVAIKRTAQGGQIIITFKDGDDLARLTNKIQS